jgi:ssDNA-binding Zn-finger/Zn-ribbon topoisomerase 1
VKESCPKCSFPFVLEKTTKKDGTVRYCNNEDCDYKMAVGNTDLTSDAAAETVPAA